MKPARPPWQDFKNSVGGAAAECARIAKLGSAELSTGRSLEVNRRAGGAHSWRMDDRPSPATAQFCFLESQRTAATLLLPDLPPPFTHPELPLAPDPPDGAPVPDGTPVARQLAASITTAVVEVIAGRRGLAQLDAWVEADVLRLVERLRFRHSGHDLRLCSLRLQFPSPDHVEVCARLSLDGFGRAAALRISRHGDGWRATSLVIALPAGVVSRAGRG